MFRPHLKVTMNGVFLGTGEIFSTGFAIGNGISPAAIRYGLEPNNAVFEDIADDCADWFGRADTRIASDVQLQTVKVASIGANGKYDASPVIKERLVTGNVGSGARKYPLQVAQVLTLHTESFRGLIKGRMFVPGPNWALDAGGRISAADALLAQNSAEQLRAAINNQPGLDVLDLRMSVASQGSVLRGESPDNWFVSDVSVGRVLDTIRTRRNKLREDRVGQV